MSGRVLGLVVAAVVLATLATEARSAPLAATPKCFGAAARDPRHPCVNPRLRLSIVPSPAKARALRNAPCTFVENRALIHVCAFGVPAAEAKGTIALIGDSHASQWRAALEVVAQAKRGAGCRSRRPAARCQRR